MRFLGAGAKCQVPTTHNDVKLMLGQLRATLSPIIFFRFSEQTFRRSSENTPERKR